MATPKTVTIEGTITPSTELPTGERRTVALTSRVEKMIKGGYIKIVEPDTDETGTVADSEPDRDPAPTAPKSAPRSRPSTGDAAK